MPCSPTGTGGSHTASVQPSSQSSVPHQTADSGAEYAVTTKVNTTTKTSHQPTEDYAMVDKNKKHAAATQGVSYLYVLANGNHRKSDIKLLIMCIRS